MAETVLLTGGAGYAGSHTAAALAAAGHRVVILDDFSNSTPSVIGRLERITGAAMPLVEADVLDGATLARVLGEHRIGAVIHFAARKAVGESVARPLDYFHTNISGLITLMRAMQAAGIFRLVFSSSATVYGEPGRNPIPETAPRTATSPYGYTKLAGERIIEQAVAADGRWQIGVLRYFNPAGAHPSGLIGEDPGGEPANLMPLIARVAAGRRGEIEVFGDDYPTPDGTGVRDYIHICDLARGHVLSLEALIRERRGHVVNLGTGQGYSVMEMIGAYSRACGRALPWRLAPRRPGDIAACWADVARAREVLGFEAEFGLEEMCETSWRWVVKA